MDKNLLENAGSKMVWRGGHGGLKLEVYEGGVLAVGNGEGHLIIAVRPVNMQNRFDLVAMIDSMRGYCANPPEIGMIGDAFKTAMRS
jgi:hypothetical protein